MKHGKLRVPQAIFFVLFLFCFGCTTADSSGPVTYNRIVIDTYDPTDPAGPDAPNSNYMELWSSDGKTLLASDSGTSSSRPAEISPGVLWPNQNYAYIDYTAGLISGDYYVLIGAIHAGDEFGYGIRVLTGPDSSYTGWTFGGPASETVSDAPPTGGSGIPSTFKTMVLNSAPNDRLNRYIVKIDATHSGVNWVKITLP